MKRKNISCFLFLACISIIGFISCEDYLDVRPKSQIPDDLHFARESGYFDQLTGVYTKMCEVNLYGREMTFGLMEVLSQNYDLQSSNLYRYAASYDYNYTSIESMIDVMWDNAYNCIANLNIMLKHIDEADPKIFEGDNHRLYKGEALGLRAFLHFDLLRIFAPSYASNPGAPAVPYVTEYEPMVTPQLTVSQTMDLIIEDLEEAVTLLANDPLHISATKYDYRSRRMYFNYYAAVATLARVYLYKGDKVNALKYAEEIITESEQETNGAFFWTHFTSLETTYDYECNRTYTTEQIFQLRINNFSDVVEDYFTQSALANSLSPSETHIEEIFELAKGYGNEYRVSKCFQYDGIARYLSKFWQYERGPYNDYFPLIRKTEAYYIAAEVLKESDKDRAIELLNTVRNHRKLEDYPLPLTLTADEVQHEIFKEYRKEFLAEGQLFFYYKRLNLSTIEGAGMVANDHVYVLPMPDIEIEFGQRK